MDREKQLTKLVNVLRRTARSARDGSDDVVEQARSQYNRVLETMSGIDEAVGTLFTPLAEGVSGPVVAAACRDLMAYFEDEVDVVDAPFDPDSFREFWRKSAKEIEDIGEFIRESLGQFQRERTKEENAQSNGKTEE